MRKRALKLEVMRMVISNIAKMSQKRKSAFLLELSALRRVGLAITAPTSR